MQKTMLLMAALVLSLMISGCGGGGTPTSVIGGTPDVLTASDIFSQPGHTFNITASKGTAAATFHTYSGTTGKDWNSNPLDTSVRQGTWSITNGTVSFNDLSGSPVKTITGIQKVYTDATKTNLAYWLISAFDGPPPQAPALPTTFDCRMYVDATPAFGNYTRSAAVHNGLMGGAIQKNSLAAFTNITTSLIETVAGTPGTQGTSDHVSAQDAPALFGKPVGITTMDGNAFFVVDNVNYNIRMLRVENGIMTVRVLKTVVAGTTTTTPIALNLPSDITTDGTNLYVTDTNNFAIQRINPDNASDLAGTWTMTKLAGTGTSGSFDGDGLTTARFAAPLGITTDGTNLYVTDNHAIRKIVISTGNVTTLAGSPGSPGATDDTGTAARFNLPIGITTDGTNLYVADTNNYAIRQVAIATGKVTKIAGVFGTTGATDTARGTATFSGPQGIATDGTNLYVSDWGRVSYGNPVVGQTIRMITPDPVTGTFGASSTVTTIAGTSGHINVRVNNTLPDSGATEPAQNAYFYCPAGITTDGTSLFVTDALNYTIRRIYKR